MLRNPLKFPKKPIALKLVSEINEPGVLLVANSYAFSHEDAEKYLSQSDCQDVLFHIISNGDKPSIYYITEKSIHILDRRYIAGMLKNSDFILRKLSSNHELQEILQGK
jgi:hypothetical protein